MRLTLANGDELLDSFPFDSGPNLVYTDQGYPRGDRSVDAWTMQRTFRQFFTNGVFGTPADAWQIAKGTGMDVTIQPGMAVIEGGMGGIKESEGPLTVTLDTQAAQGNIAYGIMLRYDNSSDTRGLAIRVKKGVAGSSPTPPDPDTTSAGVYELRLGYVVVPNGSTDLSSAQVVNEKGMSVCPYAAPFEEIDLSSVVDDAKDSGTEAVRRLLEYFDTYKDAIDSALSDEEVTYLQSQINELQQQITSYPANLSNEVDDETIEYSDGGEPLNGLKLRVKDGGIGTAHIANGAVTQQKLSNDLQIVLDIVDTTGWGFSDYLSFVSDLTGDRQTDFVKQIDTSTLKGWTASQQNQLMAVCNDESQKYIITTEGISDKTWPEIQAFYDTCNNLTVKSSFIGLTKSETIGGYGSHNFIVIGVEHDDIVGVGKARLSLSSLVKIDHSEIDHKGFWGYGNTDYNSMYFPNSNVYAALQAFYGSIPNAMKSCMASVSKSCVQIGPGGAVTGVTDVPMTVFIVSAAELGANTTFNCGTKYDGSDHAAYSEAAWTRENYLNATQAYYRNSAGTIETSKNWFGGGMSESGYNAYPCVCIA